MADFTAEDKRYIAQRDISLNEVQLQLRRFKDGFPELKLTQAAGIQNGILQLDTSKAKSYIAIFDELAPSRRGVQVRSGFRCCQSDVSFAFCLSKPARIT